VGLMDKFNALAILATAITMEQLSHLAKPSPKEILLRIPATLALVKLQDRLNVQTKPVDARTMAE